MNLEVRDLSFVYLMPYKKITLEPFTVFIPRSLNIDELASITETKPDLIAAILFQFTHALAGQTDNDGWVNLSATKLRTIHWRAERVLTSLEAAGVIEVKRNPNGQKSYIGPGFGKRQARSSSYRINPIHRPEDLKEYEVRSATTIKSLNAFVGKKPMPLLPRTEVLNTLIARNGGVKQLLKTRIEVGNHQPQSRKPPTSKVDLVGNHQPQSLNRSETSKMNVSSSLNTSNELNTSKLNRVGNHQPQICSVIPSSTPSYQSIEEKFDAIFGVES